MTPHEYVSKTLDQQTLAEDSDELKQLRDRRKEVEDLLRADFGASPTVRYGGSKSKGTMIKEEYDLDVICYFPRDDDDAGGNLETIFENVKGSLAKTYIVLPKTSAIRLQSRSHQDFHVVPKRFGKYGLALHPEKTRLVEFRHPLRRPSESDGGVRGPGSFDLLGFTHYWGKSRSGKWIVKRKTAKDRFRRALARVAQWCREHRHDEIRGQQKALAQKLLGHYGYYGITGNSRGVRKLITANSRMIPGQIAGLKRRPGTAVCARPDAPGAAPVLHRDGRVRDQPTDRMQRVADLGAAPPRVIAAPLRVRACATRPLCVCDDEFVDTTPFRSAPAVRDLPQRITS